MFRIFLEEEIGKVTNEEWKEVKEALHGSTVDEVIENLTKKLCEIRKGKTQ